MPLKIQLKSEISKRTQRKCKIKVVLTLTYRLPCRNEAFMTFKKRVRQNELKRLPSGDNHPTRYRCPKQKQNQARQSTVSKRDII